MATPFVDFRPAQVMGDKEVYVCYYVLDPTNDQLKRMRIRCNRIKNLRERAKYATLLCAEINRKLYNGWNPLIGEDSASTKRVSIVDYMGRVSEVLAPYEAEIGRPYTIRMTYIPKNYDRLDIFTPNYMQNYACTFHYDTVHPDNELRTVVITDGLGRLLQTKKDAEIGGNEEVLVTGKVVYDCFGRTVAQYHPFTEDLGTENVYNDSVTAGTATAVRYDIMDRQTYTRTPMGYVTTMTYDFDTCMGRQCFRTSVTDPKGNIVKTLTGTLGQQLKQIAPMNTVTRFEYDAIGRLTKSTDPNLNSTFYTYDMLGRMIQRIHPDAGTDRYHYDAVGNLTSHVDALADSVLYRYHFNQLTDVEYPRYPANNVHYEYGTSSDANINAVGKIILQEDASGWQTFSYGKLGELIENIRTFALPFESQTYTFNMNFEYDSWNRIQKMTYPDGEVVTYGYNRGGMLKSVVGNKNGVFSDYIKDIHYNKFELKDTVWYGNGAQACYAYDSLLRLSLLRSECADGVMQEIDYGYDSVSNINFIENHAGTLPNGLGGAYRSDYTYDNLYRLTYAKGNWYGNKDLLYETSSDYEKNGRISRKVLSVDSWLNGNQATESYDNEYHYTNTGQPNTLSYINTVHEQSFEWDLNGNMVFHHNGQAGYDRKMCWDEQNRLLGVKDEGQRISYYLYDANGDRAYKFTGEYAAQNRSGQWHYYYLLDRPTLYASPYLVSNEKGYTKHYYAESERIASRIGGGGLHDLHNGYGDYPDMVIRHQESANSLFGNVMECLGANAMHEEDALGYLYDWQELVEEEKECYWYHPDHLGSSSWITYSDGSAVQHLHYLPWGEEFVDQRATDFSARFTFSAKERDTETGYSYFGSRYYSSDLSIWLSVDPMAAKYPSLSPYVYCANNPVRLVDPNGEYLEVADDDDTHNDLLSIVGESHRNRVIFNKDGSVSVNLEGLSEEALKKDIGLSLINDMVNSDCYYYFETADDAFFCDESGNRVNHFITNDIYKGVINASNYGTDSNGEHSERPMDKFDGQVVIAKSGQFTLYGQNIRKNIVFHELKENFLRTDKQMNYQGEYNVGAHRTAAQIENNAWGNFAGQGIYTSPATPIKKSDKRVMNYLNYGIYR